jgi:hypothetical protein
LYVVETGIGGFASAQDLYGIRVGDGSAHYLRKCGGMLWAGPLRRA